MAKIFRHLLPILGRYRPGRNSFSESARSRSPVPPLPANRRGMQDSSRPLQASRRARADLPGAGCCSGRLAREEGRTSGRRTLAGAARGQGSAGHRSSRFHRLRTLPSDCEVQAPQAIVGYEIAESALFHLDAELKANYPSVPFIPVVGSIQNSARLAEVFQNHRPSLVFHAAAYKHVPMMEVHPFEAIENNVFGTYNVARIARKMGVERFVLISSDKAVRPTNIMGTTKRIAELIVQSMHSPGTKFVAVRFGNVLGSNGSVVPIFKEQIAKGGPVTVTHPEMTRYFMTIPEAAQLVLQGSSMAQGRETFVLDMGEPVRIVDLARNLILLSGLQPGTDIEIKFSGTRPGEKLYEELCTDEENTVETPHEKIRIFRGPEIDSNLYRLPGQS